MSNTIDQRVVEMKFDNRDFERNTLVTIRTLEALKKSLELNDATAGFARIEAAARNVQLGDISSSVDNISSKFNALGAIGFTLFQNLTNYAIGASSKIAGLVWDPLVNGGKQRALNIQQAKFQFEGLGMDVEATMASALAAVKGTAYGLDEAAVVASQLGASGLRAGDEMTSVLRATAGLAAMTSSSYGDIGNIMTTVAGNGRLMGQQLLQLSGRGINAAAVLGKSLGKTEQEVRDMVTKGQISFSMFSAAMDEAFGEHATAANKLFSGAMSNVRAALSRIGAEVAGPRFEHLRDVMNALIPVIDRLATVLKPFITMYNEFSKSMAELAIKGINAFNWNPLVPILDALVNILKLLGSVLKPIGEAFREVFPKKSDFDLWKMTRAFKEFTEKLVLSEKSLSAIKSVFKGFFSVISVIGKLVTYLAKGFIILAQAVLPAGGGILALVGKLGDYVTGMSDAVKASGLFTEILDRMKKAIEPLPGEFSLLGTIGDIFGTIAKKAWSLAGALGKIFGAVGGAIGEFIKNFDFERTLNIINTGLLGALILAMKNFLDIFSGFVSSGGGAFSHFQKIMFRTRQVLFAYQETLRAGALKDIAIAIGILAAALFVMSMIDTNKLAGTVAAISILFANLVAAITIMSKATEGSGLIKGLATVYVITALMRNLAIAILILSFAMLNLSKLDWNGIMQGLVAVAGLTAIIIVAAKLLSKNSKGLAKGAFGFVLFAASLYILALALEKLAELDPGALIQGLVGLGAIMTGLVIFMKVTKADSLGLKTAGGIFLLAVSLMLMATAIKMLGSMDGVDIYKGLLALGLLLAELTVFMKLNGNAEGVIAMAGALVIMGVALIILSTALGILGNMPVKVLAKGLGALALALLIMGVAMRFMEGSLKGAAALIIMAAALAILTPSLVILGAMPLKNIAKSLLMLAGTFAVIGIAALVLGPVVPLILALSAAIAVLGIAILAIGAGTMLFATAMAAIAVSGAAGTAALIGIVSGLAGMIPYVLGKIGEGIIALAKVIKEGAPAMVDAVVTLITTFIEAIFEDIPRIVDAGIDMMLAVIEGLTESLPELVDAAFKLVIAFINGLAEALRGNTEPLLEAMSNLSDAMATTAKETLLSALPGFVTTGSDLIDGFIGGIKDKIPSVTTWASRVANSALEAAKKTLGINSPSKEFEKIGMFADKGLANGLSKFTGSVTSSAKDVGKNAISALSGAVGNISDLVSGDMNLNPTIRPVLDMGGVNGELNSIFGQQRGLNLSAAQIKAANISTPRSKDVDSPIASTTKNEFNFNITGNHIANDYDVERIGQQLSAQFMRELRRNK